MITAIHKHHRTELPKGYAPMTYLCFAALVLPDDARARLRVQEEFAHFIDVLQLDVLPPGDRGENRCRGE